MPDGVVLVAVWTEDLKSQYALRRRWIFIAGFLRTRGAARREAGTRGAAERSEALEGVRKLLDRRPPNQGACVGRRLRWPPVG